MLVSTERSALLASLTSSATSEYLTTSTAAVDPRGRGLEAIRCHFYPSPAVLTLLSCLISVSGNFLYLC